MDGDFAFTNQDNRIALGIYLDRRNRRESDEEKRVKGDLELFLLFLLRNIIYKNQSFYLFQKTIQSIEYYHINSICFNSMQRERGIILFVYCVIVRRLLFLSNLPSISDHEFEILVVIDRSTDIIVVFYKFIDTHWFISPFAVSSLNQNRKYIITVSYCQG